MPPAVTLGGSRRIVIEGLRKSQNAQHVGQKRRLDEQYGPSAFSMFIEEAELVSNLWKRIEGCHCTFLVLKDFADPGRLWVRETSHADHMEQLFLQRKRR